MPITKKYFRRFAAKTSHTTNQGSNHAPYRPENTFDRLFLEQRMEMLPSFRDNFHDKLTMMHEFLSIFDPPEPKISSEQERLLSLTKLLQKQLSELKELMEGLK